MYDDYYDYAYDRYIEDQYEAHQEYEYQKHLAREQACIELGHRDLEIYASIDFSDYKETLKVRCYCGYLTLKHVKVFK